MNQQHWLLPEDVIELLPAEAFEIEVLRRRILDLMQSWGYQIVIPPLVEYLDSLLAGSGRDLDVQTFKLTDQHSGRLMGVRADMTPQIARIDAHRLPTNQESRYAYCGSVLRTRSESTEPRRNPQIIGAELFGVPSINGDMEIMALLLSILRALNIDNSVLNIGHAQIIHNLAKTYQLTAVQIAELENILQNRASYELASWQKRHQINASCVATVQTMLQGDMDGKTALEFFAEQERRDDSDIFASINRDFYHVLTQLLNYFPDQKIIIDFASVGNYGYHNGLIFSLYAAGHYGAIARGGRYDGIGEAYGRARPATGFSADLLTLAELAGDEYIAPEVIVMPCPQTPQEFAHIEQLRQAGKTIRFNHED